MRRLQVHIIGCAGIPARYGGFETLASHLVKESYNANSGVAWTVYAESKNSAATSYYGAQITRLPLRANGISSIAYDFFSLMLAGVRRADVVIILGVSGGIFIPFVKWLFKFRVVINPDGIEHRREKWGWLARKFLLISESKAVRAADSIVADNAEIGSYIFETYKKPSTLIAYGGLRPIDGENKLGLIKGMVDSNYALGICRIEPENNVEIIIESFCDVDAEISLVLVGNWRSSLYARQIYNRYAHHPNINLVGPFYKLEMVDALRSCACLYVHGHSAGGTNPSLVEAMHYRLPVIAWDCSFNRSTMKERGHYFETANQLAALVLEFHTDSASFEEEATALEALAEEEYSWDKIHDKYVDLVNSV